jgi:Cytochrome P450
MILYPECQKRAREEIDAVVGLDRLPELSDRESLPYLESVVQEAFRYCRWIVVLHDN